NDLDRAARFVYLNRFCFNGVYRTNKQGRFNVARGKGHLFIPDFETFKLFSHRLANASLHNCDFETIVNQTKAGDFLYLDPPYARQGQRDRGEYGVGAFKEIDEDRLAGALLESEKRGVKVLLSYSPSHNLIQKLDGWQIHNLTVTRNVAGFAHARRTADEILISNYTWSSRTISSV
ncbi:MAG: DNA adenine methylase, partial [Acidobacteriota bacterium]